MGFTECRTYLRPPGDQFAEALLRAGGCLPTYHGESVLAWVQARRRIPERSRSPSAAVPVRRCPHTSSWPGEGGVRLTFYEDSKRSP